MGWAITANANSGIPETLEIAWAVWTNPSVMIPVAGIPAFSMVTASCKLHDEQLPQSPTPEMTASHRLAAAIISAGAGRLASGFLKKTDRIVLYNTGSGMKYPEAYSTRFPRTASGEQDKLGGLITPR